MQPLKGAEMNRLLTHPGVRVLAPTLLGIAAAADLADRLQVLAVPVYLVPSPTDMLRDAGAGLDRC